MTLAPRKRTREDDEDEEREIANARRRRRDRCRPSGFGWGHVFRGLFAFYGIALALALVIGFLSAFGSIIFLGLVSNVGLILVIVAPVMILIHAFRWDVMDGVFCMIIPFYALHYLIKHYDDLRYWFYLNLVGILFFVTSMIGIGVLIESGAFRPAGAANAPPAFAPVEAPRPVGIPQPGFPPPGLQNNPPVNPFVKPQPVVPKVSGDLQVDTALAEIALGDVFRTWPAGDRLQRMVVKPDIQATVADKLATLAKSRNEETRKAAGKALRTWATAKEVPALIDVANGTTDFELAEALSGLLRFKDERAIPLAKEGMRHLASRDVAKRMLRSFASKSEPALIELLQETDHFVLSDTIRLLKDLGTPASIPALQQHVAGDDFFLRREAAEAIKTIQKRTK
jgi:hypothetical protein